MRFQGLMIRDVNDTGRSVDRTRYLHFVAFYAGAVRRSNAIVNPRQSTVVTLEPMPADRYTRNARTVTTRRIVTGRANRRVTRALFVGGTHTGRVPGVTNRKVGQLLISVRHGHQVTTVTIVGPRGLIGPNLRPLNPYTPVLDSEAPRFLRRVHTRCNHLVNVSLRLTRNS